MCSSAPETGENFGFDPASSPLALWESLIRDPSTGVAILDAAGIVLYANEQSLRIFHGPEAKPADQIGKSIFQTFPKEWSEDRMRVIRKARETGEPVILRSIWRGFQQVSTIRSIPGRTPDEDRILVVTRRVTSPADAPPSGIEVVESSVVGLGQLDVLTARELEVLALIGQGLSLKEIATILHRAVKTIDKHRQSIGRKLQKGDRVQLAHIALAAGLTVQDAERRRVKPLR